MREVRDLSHHELCDAITNKNNSAEYISECRLEMQLRQITGSGVECGKAFLKGMMKTWEEMGSPKGIAEVLIAEFDLALERTNSKMLIKALNSAKRKLEKVLLEFENKENL